MWSVPFKPDTLCVSMRSCRSTTQHIHTRPCNIHWQLPPAFRDSTHSSTKCVRVCTNRPKLLSKRSAHIHTHLSFDTLYYFNPALLNPALLNPAPLNPSQPCPCHLCSQLSCSHSPIYTIDLLNMSVASIPTHLHIPHRT